MDEIYLPDYHPSAKQTVFHESPAYETFFGGAAGPGKTSALAGEAVTQALRAPNTFIYVFRLTLPEIMLSIHMALIKQITPYNNRAKPSLKINFNGQTHAWKFPNGSFIQYAYCQYDADVYRYQSAEIHVLLIDELTHFKEEWYNYLKTRVRGRTNRRIMACSNPGNIGHGWVKKYFVDNGDQVIIKSPDSIDKLTGEKVIGRTRQYIKAIIDDHPNKEFRQQYTQTLEDITNERLRRALRWGDWDTFEGQVFMEWDERLHVIRRLPTWADKDGNEVDILSVSMKFVGHDIGRRDPGAAHWVAVAPENEQGVVHYYVYREFHQQYKDGRTWATEIKDVINNEPIEFVVLPHDAFAIGHGASRSYASEFDDMDVPYVRANSLSHGSRMHRQNLLHQLLQISPDGTPYLQVLDTCPNLIRTIPDLSYSTTVREEIDKNADDHDYDSLTYCLMVIDDAETWIFQAKPPEDDSVGWTEAGPTNDIAKAIKDSNERWR
jgi:hypothetical protein